MSRPFLSVTTRWVDDHEERFARRFLRNWHFADEFIIVNGGHGTDNSKAILTKDPRVKWIEFPERIPGKRSGSRNPEGKMVQTCLEAATGDWIAHTEADAWPNIALATAFRSILKRTDKLAVFSYLYYLGPGKQYHYPEVLLGPGMTAWRREANLSADVTSLFEPALSDVPKSEVLALEDPPFMRLHMTYEDEELIQRKNQFYREVHDLDLEHPDKRFPIHASLPEHCRWMEDDGANPHDVHHSMILAEEALAKMFP